MNYKKLIGFGVLIWAVAYVLAMAFYAYHVLGALWAKIILDIVVAVFAFFAACNLKKSSALKILAYSVVWVIIAFLLDLLLTVPYSGMGIYKTWDLWIGYALVLIVPLFAVKKTVQPAL